MYLGGPYDGEQNKRRRGRAESAYGYVRYRNRFRSQKLTVEKAAGPKASADNGAARRGLDDYF
ncbi:hypothetical protein D3C73_1539380 [compost metagenome]